MLFLLFLAPDIVFADFEGDDFGAWTAIGTAFGKGPVPGTLPHQMPVTGFKGKKLANSYHGTDRTTGTLTSPPFKIERKFITLLVGGGGHKGKTCVNLVVDGKVVRSTTGPEEGSETLEEEAWDVSSFIGKTASIVAVDDHTGGWGHILLDHIVFTDKKPSSIDDRKLEIVAEKKFLLLPVRDGARMRKVTVGDGKNVLRSFDIELAECKTLWDAALDISEWKGKKIIVESRGFVPTLRQADTFAPKDLYKEALRPQLHFTAKRGWINDPNGLVFRDGVWHLFFQHNPYGVKWGNMHWGHATSKDLIHWEEQGEALYPDAMGPMFSGSAVVDHDNTAGFGKNALLLAYTAFGPPATQCLAHSLDGKRWTKYGKNPVVRNIAPEDRDPKVFWHAPTKRWVMALYVGPKGKDGKVTHTIRFLTSPDLKGWIARGSVEGFYECPDLFPLKLDGKTKWVLTAASSEYMVGDFDGETFKPETKKLPGHRGRAFYAPQTFDNAGGRRIQIGWGQMPSPGMPFTGLMTFPCELSLRQQPDGPRLVWTPVKEIEKLRAKSYKVEPRDLKAGDDNPLSAIKAELADFTLEAAPEKDAELVLDVRGIKLRYDAKTFDLHLGDHKTWLPLTDGKLKLRVLIDRTSLTAWGADGLIYVPFPAIPKEENLSFGVSVTKGAAKGVKAELHELRSIWR